MKKTLKTLVLSLLTTNLLVGTLSTIVRAEDTGGETSIDNSYGGDNGDTGTGNNGGDNTGGDNTGGDNTGGDNTGGDGTGGDNTGGDNTGGDGTGSDDIGDDDTGDGEGEGEGDSESSSEEENSSSEEEISSSEEESTVTPPVVVPVPSYPSNPYTPPRTESRTPVTSAPQDETTEAPVTTIAKQYESAANLEKIESLLKDSLKDANFVLAWEDYKVLLTDYNLTDISDDNGSGSSLHEIVSNFSGNAVPIRTENVDGQIIVVLSYVDEESESTEEDVTPTNIVLYGDEDANFIGAGMFQASNVENSVANLDAELLNSLVGKSFAELISEDFFVEGFYQILSNDIIYTSFATPSNTEGNLEIVTIASEFVLDYHSVEQTEGLVLDQLQFEVQDYIEGLAEVAITEETTTDETTAVVEEEPAEDVSTFVTQFAPPGYNPDKLTEFDKIKSSYDEIVSKIDNGTLTLTPDELVGILGEPNNQLVAGRFAFFYYYSVENTRVSLLEVEMNSETNEVSTLRYDVRTEKLYEPFDVTVDGLFEIAKEEMSIANLEKNFEQPDLIEHMFTGGHTIRYVWTSLADPEMRSIEAFENPETKEIELYYYDQE